MGKFEEESRGWCFQARMGMMLVFGRRQVEDGELSRLEQDLWSEMGERRRIKFSQDVWCGDSPLKDSFPSHFSFLAYKKVGWLMFKW